MTLFRGFSSLVYTNKKDITLLHDHSAGVPVWERNGIQQNRKFTARMGRDAVDPMYPASSCYKSQMV